MVSATPLHNCFKSFKISFMRSVQKVSSHVLWKIEPFLEVDTRYKKHCTQDNDALVPFKAGTLGSHTVLPTVISYPVIFSWISLLVWNCFLIKGDFSFGKSQKSQGIKSVLSGGWVTWVIWCFTKNSTWDMMHEQVPCWDEAANFQLPIAAAFWIFQIVSMEECSSLMQNLMQICCSTCSVIFNARAT